MSSLERSLRNRIYWPLTRDTFNDVLTEIEKQTNRKEAAVLILDRLGDIMTASKIKVEEQIDKRIESGEIKDARQARKSVAGSNFQALVAYSLEVNRKIGNLVDGLNITLAGKEHKMICQYAEIDVGDGEVQKPDVDVLLSLETRNTPITILSCKTSLRERAGQTYRWKLLVDLAKCKCKHLEDCALSKYKLSYTPRREICIDFVTCDLYDERNSPQQRGMFQFFDRAYVTKETTEDDCISPFSHVISHLCQRYPISKNQTNQETLNDGL